MVLVLALQSQAQAAIGWGAQGENVRLVQQKLKQWGYYGGSVDGVYGAKTYAALVSFQKKNGLKADGVVGSATAAALGISLSSTASGNNSYKPSRSDDRSDLQLLARLVHGEARGEGYTGKVAVAACVLNRVKSSKFPNTITGVIYQPGAFTCVSDGQISLTPSTESISAARDALNGWDPSYGALYYYNPKTATSTWIFSLLVHVTIGNHRFAK